MSNKIIYPIIIIIFSVLIICAIVNNRNNSKINKYVESFAVTDYNLPDNQDMIKSSIANNNNFTTAMINGNWTCDLTKVDENYVASNLMKITIKTLQSTDNNYGTIIYKDQTYTIVFLLGGNLNAVIIDSNGNQASQNMHIKFYNNFSSDGLTIINPTFPKLDEFNSVVSIYDGNSLITKFASYKIYTPDNKVGGLLYRIIVSQNYLINIPPPLYDYTAYNKIISNYVYPKTFITIGFGKKNDNVLNALNSLYNGSIYFAIQRVFYSPTNDNTDITTNISPKISVKVVSKNEIPSTVTICPFKADQSANGLTTFFRPKATILYFYKYINQTVAYKFGNPDYINVPNSSLNIKNNANTVTAPNIKLNDIKSVEKDLTNVFQIQSVNRYTGDLNNATTLKFSDLIGLL